MEMEVKALQKRRIFNLAVKTRLQLKYLRLIVGTIVVMMVIVALTFYATFQLTLSTAQLGRYAEARLNEVFSWLNWLLLLECMACILLAAFFSLKLTHKIAGPLFRVEKIVKDMADRGIVEEIKIRKDDDLQELVDAMNTLLTKVKR